MKEYTKELAKWVTKNRYEDIPKDVIEKMKMLILDAIGCALHGSNISLVVKVTNIFANEDLAESGCVIWGTRKKARVDMATLINGTAVQSDELDEAGQETHASASNLTSLLALSEKLGNVNGRSFLNSLVIGQEVLFRIANCFTAKGFFYQNLHYHQAGILSPIGTVATLAQVYGLNAEQVSNAFGLACNRGFSLETSRISSDDKRMMQARGGMNGVHSVMLAKQGFTGIENIFETDGGYFQFFTQSKDLYDLDALIFKLGKEWYTLFSELKRYMGMILLHRHYFCAKKLKEKFQFNIKDINEIEIMVSPIEYQHSNHAYDKIGNKIFAQFCIPYGVAVMLIEGNVFLNEFTPDKLQRPDIVNLSNKSKLIVNPTWSKKPDEIRPSQITVYLKDGRILRESVHFGAKIYPLTKEEVIEKFKILASPVFSKNRLDEIVDMVFNLDKLENVVSLAQLLISEIKVV